MCHYEENLEDYPQDLYPDKTKVIEFDSYAIAHAKKRGQGRPQPFDFLNFIHICERKRSNGMFTVIRKTKKKKMRTKLKQIRFELRKRMHHPVLEVDKSLKSVAEDFYRYYGVPMNLNALKSFRFLMFQLMHYRYWTINRRSQKPSVTGERMKCYINQWLIPQKVYNPYSLLRAVFRDNSSEKLVNWLKVSFNLITLN